MANGADNLDKVIDPSGGANQVRVRAHNERLVLSLVRRHGELPKSEIARRSGLSAQTVSVIMRALEADGLLLRGEPRRGKVGQPSIPMMLNPEGAYCFGLKIGRRSADLVLMNFIGGVRSARHDIYKYPSPDEIIQFVANSIGELLCELKREHRKKIVGLGIAMPFELWNWAEEIGVNPSLMDAWRHVDLAEAIRGIVPYPVFLQNDATAACGAELVFGRGPEFSDFAYFFVGTFIGGGIVLNHSLFSGNTGNAGAFGPMPVGGGTFPPDKLIDHASIVILERALTEAGIDPSPLWLNPYDWRGLGHYLDDWIVDTARALAVAAVSCCCVIDFPAIIIDGGFPTDIRKRLVNAVSQEITKLDLRGIASPQILEGSIGTHARAIGGASLPLYDRFLLDQNVVFKSAI